MSYSVIGYRHCFCTDIVYTRAMQDTTIQIRIDAKTKKAAQKVFQKQGLDLSSGVKLMLRQAVTNKDFAFAHTPHKWTDLRHWRLYEKEIAWEKKYGKRYATAEEAHADILKGMR